MTSRSDQTTPSTAASAAAPTTVRPHGTRRTLLTVAALAPIAWPLLACARGENSPEAGVEYTEVSPAQPVETGAKIEAREFFFYACPHCHAFEPALNAWIKRLPPDVDFKRTPVAFDDRTLPHVRIYYTLELLNRLKDFNGSVYEGIHVQHRQLSKPDEIADFFAAKGIDRQQWLDAFNSFTVSTHTNRAGQIWRAYKIDGTPTLAVDGKFLTSPSMAGTLEGSLKVMDFLIERARRERGKK